MLTLHQSGNDYIWVADRQRVNSHCFESTTEGPLYNRVCMGMTDLVVGFDITTWQSGSIGGRAFVFHNKTHDVNILIEKLQVLHAEMV